MFKEYRKLLVAVVILALVCLLGCMSIRPDANMDSISANYPSAEFYACDRYHHGLGICVVKNESLKGFVQGYYNGSVRIVYSVDNQSLEQVYIKSQKINFEKEAREDFITGMLVMPKYPRQDNMDIQVYNLEGFIYVKVAGENKVITKTTKVREGLNEILDIQVVDKNPIPVLFSGCGGKYENQVYPVIDGKITISLQNILGDLKKKDKPCVILGAIKGEEKIEVVWYVAIYDKDFVPLDLPAINLDDDELEVTGNDTVSIMGLDDDFKVTSYDIFKKFDKDTPHILRLVTVKGRTVLGIWNGEWSWKN